MINMKIFYTILILLGVACTSLAELSISPTSKSIGLGTRIGNHKHSHGWDRPQFDDISPRNITTIVGQAAQLSCYVKNPGDRTVSWMRKKDLHILTSSINTYTGDERFSAIHPEGSNEWRLKIEFVQLKDTGVYECQVNTEPKMNLAFNLRVEAAQAIINGPEEVYVMKGSTISLTCSVNVQSIPPSSISWSHGNTIVDFDSPRGGISLETEKTESGTTSKLLVTQARSSDSGNYTCIPSNANSASVLVHVLNDISFFSGEHPAAMQHGGSLVINPGLHLATLVLITFYLLR